MNARDVSERQLLQTVADGIERDVERPDDGTIVEAMLQARTGLAPATPTP